MESPGNNNNFIYSDFNAGLAMDHGTIGSH
jgi:hypothetical protein